MSNQIYRPIDESYFEFSSPAEGGGLAAGDDFSFYLTGIVKNGAGNDVTSVWNTTIPLGAYTMNSDISNTLVQKLEFANYEFSFVPAGISVVGDKYKMTLESGPNGVAELTSHTGDSFVVGTQLNFRAIPSIGYEVDQWKAYVGNEATPRKTQTGGNTFSIGTFAATTKVEVTFKQKDITLNFEAAPAAAGSVTAKDDGDTPITSGDRILQGTLFTLTAQPAENNEFLFWRVYSGSSAPEEYLGMPDAAARTNSLDWTMPGDNVSVVAIFDAAKYEIAFSDNLTVSYTTAELSTPIGISSGAVVPYGVTLVVTAIPGHVVSEWTEYPDDAAYDSGTESYTYTVAAPAHFEADTIQHYTLLVPADDSTYGFSASVTIDGILYTEAIPAGGLYLPIGTEVSIEAVMGDPDYLLEHWNIESLTDPSVTIGVFAQNTVTLVMDDSYEVTAVFAAAKTDPVISYDDTTISCATASGDPVGSGDSVAPRTVLTFTAIRDDSENVVSWSYIVGSSSINAQQGGDTFNFTMPAFDAEIFVVVATNTYTVTVNDLTPGGTYTLDCGTGIEPDAVPEGSTVVITVRPDPAYDYNVSMRESDFDNADEGADKYTISAISSDVIIDIEFLDTRDYVVTLNTTNLIGGTMQADRYSAKAGDTVTLTANPSQDYAHNGWSVQTADGRTSVPVLNNQFIMPAGNVIVSTMFIKTSIVGPGPSGPSSSSTVVTNQYTVINNGVVLNLQNINTKNNYYVIDIRKDSSKTNEIEMTAIFLEELKKENPNFIMDILTSYGRFRIPVNIASLIPGPDALLTSHGLTASDISFMATLTDVSEDEIISRTLTTGLPNARHLGPVVDFNIYVINSATKEVLHEAKELIESVVRMIPVPSRPQTRYGAFLYEPGTRSLHFTPHKAVVLDGSWYVAISPFGNSIYSVAEYQVNFTDVRKDHWAISYIERASSKKLVHGVGDNSFQPESDVNRAEFVQMIVNAFGARNYSAETREYSDVNKQEWFYDAIMGARANGLLDYFNQDKFNPRAAITREEMAAVLAATLRYAKYDTKAPAVDLQSRFDDYSKMNSALLVDIELVCRAQLMEGVAEGTFSPQGVTTRAQATTVLIRLLEALDMIDK